MADFYHRSTSLLDALLSRGIIAREASTEILVWYRNYKVFHNWYLVL